MLIDRLANGGSDAIEGMLFLSVCHTVVTEKKSDGSIVYNASSPDELALLNFAKFVGFEYLGMDQNNVLTIRYKDREEKTFKFQLLHVLEFNSTRKRMSVIVRDCQKNEIVLMTKGADSVIDKRLVENTDPTLKMTTWEHLHQ